LAQDELPAPADAPKSGQRSTCKVPLGTCLPAGFTYTSSTVVTDHIDRLILVDLDYALQAAMVPIRGFSDRPGLPMVVADVFYLGAARATPRDDF